MAVFGTDFPTRDGSAVRDYIHVTDLVDAHIAALDKMDTHDEMGAGSWPPPSAEYGGGHVELFNVGVGQGYSVLEFTAACKAATGADIKVEHKPRRPGDYADVFANVSKVQRELKWRAKHVDLPAALATAWRWREKNPDGFPGWNRPPFVADSLTGMQMY